MKRIALVGLVSVGVALSGCAKKRPTDLPPPPPAVGSESYDGAATSDAGSTTVPGSQADLIAKAGSDRVFFAYDSYELSEEARSVLVRQAGWLRDNPGVSLTLEGHADERGTREYNLALGERRANSVKNFLGSQGISAARLRIISYGKERPEVQGSDEESYAQNRRAVSVVAN